MSKSVLGWCFLEIQLFLFLFICEYDFLQHWLMRNSDIFILGSPTTSGRYVSVMPKQ
jgi:hypothetical protein